MSPETVDTKSTVSLGLGHTLCASAAGLLCWGCPCVRRGSASMKTSVPTRLLGYEVAGLPPGLSLNTQSLFLLQQRPGVGTGHRGTPAVSSPHPCVWAAFPCMLGPGWCLHMTQTLVALSPSPGLWPSVWPSICRTDGTFALLLALLSAFPLISAPTPTDLQDRLASQRHAWPCRPCLPGGRPAAPLTMGC